MWCSGSGTAGCGIAEGAPPPFFFGGFWWGLLQAALASHEATRPAASLT